MANKNPVWPSASDFPISQLTERGSETDSQKVLVSAILGFIFRPNQ